MNKKAFDKFVSVLGGAPCFIKMANMDLQVRIQESCELGALAKYQDELIFVPYTSIVYLYVNPKPGKKD